MMPSAIDIVRDHLQHAFGVMTDNLRDLTLEEAFFVPPGGYRSVLGTLKHSAGWSHVYHSYAFDPAPRHWAQLDWPRGLRDTVAKEIQYVDELLAWFRLAHGHWMDDLSRLSDDDLWRPRPLHWGETAPLHHIVTCIAGHHIYHAGELNQVLSIARGEAWEEGEEVEENNVLTTGHRVRPPWQT
jgi:hypothetical protein